jgi:sulfatase maturation enzyme AslB (radical SAM superfamily)
MQARLDRVRKANIDVCTVCNHRCVFCPSHDRRAVRTVLPLADFCLAMSQLAAATRIEELGLSAKGEPLLNPELAAIVSAAKREFSVPYVYISTNGALLDQARLAALLDAGLDSLKFSLNAFDRETYAAVHGRDDFEAVLANVRGAIAARQGGRRLRILISAVSELPGEAILGRLGDLLGEGLGQVDRIVRYGRCYMPDCHVERAPDPASLAPCPLIFREVYIDASLDLMPCCVDYFGELRFGSLRKTPLAELWNGPDFEHLRELHQSRTLPADHLCAKCLAHSSRTTDFVEIK